MARETSGIAALVIMLGLSSFVSCAKPPLHTQPGSNAVVIEPGQFPRPAVTAPGTITVNDEAPSDSRGKVPLKEIHPGVFQLADVKIDKERRTVSFPAVMNLRQGPMEYLLVSSWGKVHESILRTETEPYHIHVAMLLLGAKGAGTNEDDAVEVSGSFVSHPSSMRIPGDDVGLEVTWTSNGKVTRKRAGELVLNLRSKSALRRGDWVYNGSLVDGRSFLAQREGSIVSLVTDPEALINNSSPGHDDDSIWTVNTNNLPLVGVPVEVIIKLIHRKPG